jgi:hypothetical protein
VTKKQKSDPPKDYCFWCFKFVPVEIDHVPPRAIFPKREHGSLPSVPACSKCNRDWSKDGEYFRDVLLLGTLREVKHPDLDVLRAARNRANTRRKKERGRRSTFDSGMTVTLESPIF